MLMKYVKWWTSEGEWLNWLNIHCTPILSWELMRDAQMQLDNAFLLVFFFPPWKYQVENSMTKSCVIYFWKQEFGMGGGLVKYRLVKYSGVYKERDKRFFTYLFLEWVFWHKAWIFPSLAPSSLSLTVIDILVRYACLFLVSQKFSRIALDSPRVALQESDNPIVSVGYPEQSCWVLQI